MILPLAYYGNPVLRKKTARVEQIDDELREFVKNMEETMTAHNGYGLAAPQVHRSIALFIINISKQIRPNQWVPGITYVFINPKILNVSEEGCSRGEGCLSIPGVYGEVIRPSIVKVQATDMDGKTFEKEFKGIEARAILHENDHINGVLFIDRIHGKERQELEPELRAVKKKYAKS